MYFFCFYCGVRNGDLDLDEKLERRVPISAAVGARLKGRDDKTPLKAAASERTEFPRLSSSSNTPNVRASTSFVAVELLCLYVCIMRVHPGFTLVTSPRSDCPRSLAVDHRYLSDHRPSG